MPPKRGQAPNQLWIDLLEAECERELERDPESNKARSYASAIRSLRYTEEYYAQPQDAIKKVKFLGAKIAELLDKLLKKYGHAGDSDSDQDMPAAGPSRPKAPTKKPQKKAVQEVRKPDSDDEIDSDLDVLDQKATRRAIRKSPSAAKPSKVKKSTAANQRVYDDWESEPEAEKRKKQPAKKASKHRSQDDNVDSDAEPASSAATKAKKAAPKKRAAKLYVPKHRSGPAALIIGLFKAYRDAEDPIDDFNENLRTKEEMARLAQPETETDMLTTNHKAGQHWSGMSSLKKLIETDYMIKRGRAPVKYKLSKYGLAIAIRMCQANKEDVGEVLPLVAEMPTIAAVDSADSVDEEEASPIASTSKITKKRSSDSAHMTEAKKKSSATAPKPIYEAKLIAEELEAPFEYVYLDDYQGQTKSRADAETKQGESSTVYKILFKKLQRSHPFARFIEDKESRDDGVYIEGFLPRNKSDAAAPGLKKTGVSGNKAAPTNETGRRVAAEIGNLMGEQDDRRRLMLAAAEKRFALLQGGPAPEVQLPKKANMSASPPIDMSTEDEDGEETRPQAKRPKLSDKGKGKAPATTASQSPVLPLPSLATFVKRPSLARRISAIGGAIEEMPRYDMSNLAIMRPGEFRIVLCIDHRERESACRMKNAGVNFEARDLSLGDAIWIAQRNIQSDQPEDDEFVLDLILERKRMDDLIQSLKDKRYDDQKVRMRKSGLTRLYYLIENYDDTKIARDWDQQMWTTRSQSQVIDGFITLQAESLSDVIDHHRRLTAVVQELFRDKTLYGIKSAGTNRRQYLAQLEQLRESAPNNLYLPTYTTFQSINSKQHSLQTQWASMVHSVNGMSAEKTGAFVARFPTPNEFYTEIDALRVEEEGEGSEEESVKESSKAKKRKRKNRGEVFVQEQAGDGSTRGIKGALSEHFWHLYTDKKYNKPDK